MSCEDRRKLAIRAIRSSAKKDEPGERIVHVARRVRGVLCNRSNRGIGFFLDDPQLLLAAVEYLRAR